MAQNFSLDIRAWCEKAKDRADLVVQKLALDIGRRVVERSPVGDPTLWKNPPPPGYVGGRFRANWQYGVGQPNVKITEQTDAGGTATIARIATAAASARLGEVIYLSNSLPYALRLEAGYSKQAPAGMVGLTVAEFQAAVNRSVAAAKAETP